MTNEMAQVLYFHTTSVSAEAAITSALAGVSGLTSSEAAANGGYQATTSGAATIDIAYQVSQNAALWY
jgi:hypothetical protein